VVSIHAKPYCVGISIEDILWNPKTLGGIDKLIVPLHQITIVE
jgi:hypothetical protein